MLKKSLTNSEKETSNIFLKSHNNLMEKGVLWNLMKKGVLKNHRSPLH